MLSSKIEKDIHCWVYEFLAKPNELLDWQPVCPYAAKALHEWLKLNFVKDIERHAKVEHLLNETGIPNHRHGYTEEA